LRLSGQAFALMLFFGFLLLLGLSLFRAFLFLILPSLFYQAGGCAFCLPFFLFAGFMAYERSQGAVPSHFCMRQGRGFPSFLLESGLWLFFFFFFPEERLFQIDFKAGAFFSLGLFLISYIHP